MEMQRVSDAKTECETLMSSMLPFAEQMLIKHGEFFPFGGAMQNDGKIVSVSGYDGNEQPPSDHVIDLIKRGLLDGARKGKYRATALVCDVKVNLPATGEKSDLISVSLNHRDDYSVIVMFPYRIEGGDLAFAAPYAERGEDYIFSPS